MCYYVISQPSHAIQLTFHSPNFNLKALLGSYLSIVNFFTSLKSLTVKEMNSLEKIYLKSPAIGHVRRS